MKLKKYKNKETGDIYEGIFERYNIWGRRWRLRYKKINGNIAIGSPSMLFILKKHFLNQFQEVKED